MVTDGRTGAVGRFLGVVTGLCWIRPVGSGDAWTAAKEDVRPATAEETARARQTHGWEHW